MIDRPGMLMPDIGLIIVVLMLGVLVVVLFAAPAINRWVDRQD